MIRIKGNSKSRQVARGNADPQRPHIRRISMAIENEMFADIRQRAIDSNLSFAEQVRVLLEWGIESADTTLAHNNRRKHAG